MARTDNTTSILLLAAIGMMGWEYFRMTNTGNGAPTPANKVELPETGPLGIRNNNPGNIRPSFLPWNGTIGTNAGFTVFDNPVNGIRALFKLLKNYRSLYGIDTIEKIARRYAPSNENNTLAWATNVSHFSGLPMRTPLNFDFATLTKLAKGIIAAENGKSYGEHYGLDVFSQAWAAL